MKKTRKQFPYYWSLGREMAWGFRGLLVTVDSYHYTDIIMGTIASQITSFTILYSTVYSDADQRKYQSAASLAFVWGIHRRPVNSPHKWPVTRKMFPFDDVIIAYGQWCGALTYPCFWGSISFHTQTICWANICSASEWRRHDVTWNEAYRSRPRPLEIEIIYLMTS